MDRVRKQEHRELMGLNDHRLKGGQYVWPYLPDKHRPTLETLKTTILKVAKAWAMKESLNNVWNDVSPGWSRRRFVEGWLAWVNASDLSPTRKVGKRIHEHMENILAFCRHRVTNGVAEGLDSKRMAIKRKACDYRPGG